MNHCRICNLPAQALNQTCLASECQEADTFYNIARNAKGKRRRREALDRAMAAQELASKRAKAFTVVSL